MRTYCVIEGFVDEAVLSRVHVSLHIQSFTTQGQRQIWDMLFKTYIRQHPDVLVETEAKEYATTSSMSTNLMLNGLEMRNGMYLNVDQRAADADPTL